MIFDELLLPQIKGSSDKQDSAFMAGMMSAFAWPGWDAKNCEKYVDKHGNLVRHPVDGDNALDFSRDQMIPLISGNRDVAIKALKIMRSRHWVFPNGDVASPSVANHMESCAGEKPTRGGKVNLIIDILYSAYGDKEHETNQLLCLCKEAGPFYMKLLKRLKKDLNQNIRDYWSFWRREPEFAEHIIKQLEKY